MVIRDTSGNMLFEYEGELKEHLTERFLSDQVWVRAKVDGLKDEEPVLVYYTTADGQSVDQAVAMTLSEGANRHQCKLPPDERGLQQDLQYYLTAGDCTTRLSGTGKP